MAAHTAMLNMEVIQLGLLQAGIICKPTLGELLANGRCHPCTAASATEDR